MPATRPELIESYDLVIDGSDNFATRYTINDACVLLGKPLVYGALYTFQGQVSVFNFAGGPTYRCLFPTPPNPQDSPNCAEVGVVGVLPGLIGCMQATEALKLLTGIGVPLSGKLLVVDALSMESRSIALQRNPEQATVSQLRPVVGATACTRPEPEGRAISPVDLNVRMDAYQLLDIREDWERALCALPGAHIPLSQLASGAVELSAVGLDPSKPLCVYCKSGLRSQGGQ